jgi:hypothetical protein
VSDQRQERPDHARARRWRVAMTLSGSWGAAKHLGLIDDALNTAMVDACDRWMRNGEGDPPMLPADLQKATDDFYRRMKP